MTNCKPQSMAVPFTLKIYVVVACLFITVGVMGQNTILWKVEHPETTTQSYLLGTFHQMGNSFVDSIPKIKELLYASDIAFFESVDAIDSLRATLNRREDKFEYREELRKSDVAFLENLSESWAVPISKLTPIELNIKLNQEYTLNTCGTARPTDEWNNFDKYLIHLAKENDVPVSGLETDSLQTEDINEMAEGYDWEKARGNIKKMVRNIKKSKTNTPMCKHAQRYMNFEFNYQFEEKCGNTNIIKRNNEWMPTILEHLEKENVFVASGLLHLYGECGLIEQLRENGYVVEPVDIVKTTGEKH